jgi:hypothetical protein
MSLKLGQKHSSAIYEKEAVRRIFWPKKDQEREEKLQIKVIHNLSIMLTLLE